MTRRECSPLRIWLYALTVRPEDMYRGQRWRRLANCIRFRDDFRCQRRNWYGRRCNRPAYTVHHRWPLARARRWGWLGFRLANLPPMLITVCEVCHERIHERDINHNGVVG